MCGFDGGFVANDSTKEKNKGNYLLKALLFEIAAFEKTKSKTGDMSDVYRAYGKVVKRYAESNNNDDDELLEAISESSTLKPIKASVAVDKIAHLLKCCFQYNDAEATKIKYFKAYNKTLQFALSDTDASKEWLDDKNVFDKTVSDIERFTFYDNGKYKDHLKETSEILDKTIGLTPKEFLKNIKKLKTASPQ